MHRIVVGRRAAVGNRHRAVALLVVEGAARTVHRQVLVVGADPVELGVVVGEQARLQHLVRAVAQARHDVRRRQRGLLDVGVVVVRIAVQLQDADLDAREVALRPDLGQIEGIPAGFRFPGGALGVVHDLDLDAPAREVAPGNRVEQIALGVVRVKAGQAHGVRRAQILDALQRLEVPLDPVQLAFIVDQAVGVAAEAVHVAVAVRGAAA
jgi:hypothetical protein